MGFRSCLTRHFRPTRPSGSCTTLNEQHQEQECEHTQHIGNEITERGPKEASDNEETA